MRFRVQIDGYVDVDSDATEKDVEEAVYFQICIGGLKVDNPVGEPDWAEVEVMVDEIG